MRARVLSFGLLDRARAAARMPSRRFAIGIIVGGLALSQVLTLYTTPVVYIYLDRLQTWLFGEKRKQAVAGHAQPEAAE